MKQILNRIRTVPKMLSKAGKWIANFPRTVEVVVKGFGVIFIPNLSTVPSQGRLITGMYNW